MTSMNNLNRAIVVHTALVRAGKANILGVKILLTCYLMEDKPLVHELAKELKVTAPGISRSLDLLEKEGLVQRKREEDADRRQVRVAITKKGINYIEKLVAE